MFLCVCFCCVFVIRWWGVKPWPAAGWFCSVCGCVSTQCRLVWRRPKKSLRWTNWIHQKVLWVERSSLNVCFFFYQKLHQAERSVWFWWQTETLWVEKRLMEKQTMRYQCICGLRLNDQECNVMGLISIEQNKYELCRLTGHRPALRPLPQGSHWVPGERSSF